MAEKKKRRRVVPARRFRTTARVTRVASPGLAYARGGFQLKEDEVERMLLTGENAGRLQEHFGEAQYQELRQLAQESSARSVRGGPRVLILPGIMGSTLGWKRILLDDVLWIDPIDIAVGKLTRLALPSSTDVVALGAILLAYLKLKLRLRIAGYDAAFKPYDWRQSLDDIGSTLQAELADERRPLHLVAHSMGGLAARAAIAQGLDLGGGRLVMLGTPNRGSFAPVQAIRATYDVVRKVAAIDATHTPEELAEKVFSTFPGLYQMLPFVGHFSTVNLYDPKAWPTSGPGPVPALLKGAPSVQDKLAKPNASFFLVAGINQDTVTGLHSANGEFVYETSRAGDGTVPLALAQLEGVPTYFVEESHGSLPNNGTVERAVIDLLGTGKTTALPDHWDDTRARGARQISETALRQPAFEGRTGPELSTADLRHLIDEVASPDSRDSAAVPATSFGLPLTASKTTQETIVVGRRRQHRIDIRLALGNIVEVDTRAYVLGLFREVTPTGAARDLNQRLGGAIKEFTTRRMFSGNVGEAFIMPSGRHALRAEQVLFAGLGAFDTFNSDIQQLAAENAIRTFLQVRIDDFATVLFGAGSGRSADVSLANILTGFLRGLRDADQDHRFRQITVCELDPDAYESMKRELLRLTTTPLFDDFEVTIVEMVLPTPVPMSAERRLPAPDDNAYLVVRREGNADPEAEVRQAWASPARRERARARRSTDDLYLRFAVLSSGSKATVMTELCPVSSAKLETVLRDLETARAEQKTLDSFGRQLSALLLPDRIVAALGSARQAHLVVVHDAETSRIPWETIRIPSRVATDGDGGWCPAMDGGLTRRYAADNLSIAKWLEERRRSGDLSILLVVNPNAGDPDLNLKGAEEEGERLRALFAQTASVRIETLHGDAATKPALLSAFQSGKYDVLHYAGHAMFDPRQRQRSGILCHGGALLTGADLVSLSNLPSLVFFNACESGRVRQPKAHERLETSVGLAEAFLRGGLANYVGTYWPVGDAAAKTFASTFYESILAGGAIGEALLKARTQVRADGSADWADYVHYGTFDFRLKLN